MRDGTRPTTGVRLFGATWFALWVWLAATGCGDVCVDDACAGDPQSPNPTWDTDGDHISNLTENHPPNAYLGFVDTIPNEDPSRAIGVPNGGSLDSAINLPDNGQGYTHYLGTDGAQADDWAVLATINAMEDASREWGQDSAFSTCRLNSQWTPTIRAQIGDLSLQMGGFWTDHDSHQNGLDADLRYLRDDAEGQLDLRDFPPNYDPYATVDLLSCLLLDASVQLILLDTALSSISTGGNQRLLHDPDHYNHFHVRVFNPTRYGQ